MASTNGESDRNTEWFDAPSDGPDGYRDEEFAESFIRCLYCAGPMPDDAIRCEMTYCSDACANAAASE